MSEPKSPPWIRSGQAREVGLGRETARKESLGQPDNTLSSYVKTKGGVI